MNSIGNKFGKCIAAILNDAIDRLLMGVSAYHIVKHLLVIKKEHHLSLNKAFKGFYYSRKLSCINTKWV